jgi:hypothetical protein
MSGKKEVKLDKRKRVIKYNFLINNYPIGRVEKGWRKLIL